MMDDKESASYTVEFFKSLDISGVLSKNYQTQNWFSSNKITTFMHLN